MRTPAQQQRDANWQSKIETPPNPFVSFRQDPPTDGKQTVVVVAGGSILQMSRNLERTLHAYDPQISIILSPKADGATKRTEFNFPVQNATIANVIDEFAKHVGLSLKVVGKTYSLEPAANSEPTIESLPTPRSLLPNVDALLKLESELNQTFPDSVVRLSRVGKQVIVRGQAHDVIEADRILRIIRAEYQGNRLDNVPAGTATTQRARGTSQPFGLPTGGLTSNIASNLNLDTETITQPILSSGPVSPDVIDMLTVNGIQQVTLRVVVAEVNRTAARSIGINFGVSNDAGTSIFQNLTGGIKASGNAAGGNLPTLLDNGQVQLAINALKSMNLSKTLAEPNLTAMNGESAKFQAGGQFPIPVVGGSNGSNLQGVTYVPFGVQLEFTPFITDRDRVRLVVSAEVSARDPGIATNIGGAPDQGGTSVAGLNQRKFQTTVELREGQTLAVAGLIQSNSGGKSNRVPFLGDLPWIGRFAASDESSAGEQELVILITPELTHPLPVGSEIALPGQDIYEPDDIEFYLLGRLEAGRPNNHRSVLQTDLARQRMYYADQDPYLVGDVGYCDYQEAGGKR